MGINCFNSLCVCCTQVSLGESNNFRLCYHLGCCTCGRIFSNNVCNTHYTSMPLSCFWFSISCNIFNNFSPTSLNSLYLGSFKTLSLKILIHKIKVSLNHRAMLYKIVDPNANAPAISN